MNLIQLLTDQRAYKGITHSRWGASWNWRWRRVGDDEEQRPPSPEPRMDSSSALPREIRAWRRLRIVKHVETSSLIFFLRGTEYMELELRSVEHQGSHETGGAPPPSWTGCGPLALILSPIFFIFSKSYLRGFAGHSENFCFCT